MAIDVGNLRHLLRLKHDHVKSLAETVDAPSDDAAVRAALRRVRAIDAMIAARQKQIWQRLATAFAVAVCVIVFCIGIAASYRGGTVNIELDGKVDKVEFRVVDGGILTEPVTISELAVDGAERIEWPIELTRPPTGRVQRVEAIEGALLLAPIEVPPGTWISVELLEANRVRVDLTNTSGVAIPDLAVSVPPRIHVDGLPSPVTLPGTRHLGVRPPAKSLRLTLTTAQLVLTRPMAVNELRFVREDPTPTGIDNVSSIRSLAIEFPGNERQPMTLRESTWLDLGGLTGFVRAVRIDGSGSRADPPRLAASYSGSVSRLMVGGRQPSANALPSLLERIGRRSDVTAIVTTLVAVVSLFAAIFSWWRTHL